MKEILLNMLSGALETIGESKLVTVLQQLHDNNPTEYKAAIMGGNALVLSLQNVVGQTKTQIDDAIIKALDEAITQSAMQNSFSFVTGDFLKTS